MMLLTTTVLPLLFSSLAASKPSSFFGSDQHVLDEALSVPGDNPLTFCQDSKDYSLDIKYVDLTPNPPQP